MMVSKTLRYITKFGREISFPGEWKDRGFETECGKILIIECGAILLVGSYAHWNGNIGWIKKFVPTIFSNPIMLGTVPLH